jgi:nucleoside-diphosphate-sugar epimerase
MQSLPSVLVIGATGTIGRQVLSQLATVGARVRALTRQSDTVGLPREIEIVRGDLTMRKRSMAVFMASIRFSWCGPRLPPPSFPL